MAGSWQANWWADGSCPARFNGFNAVVPNMLWAGAAFYPSKVLPVAATVAEKGDQVAQCLRAARKHGVQVHVWKVNWNLGHSAPAEFVERMRRESRLQASSRGKQDPWLCPSHPENRKLEVEPMVELAIRYPDGDHYPTDNEFPPLFHMVRPPVRTGLSTSGCKTDNPFLEPGCALRTATVTPGHSSLLRRAPAI